ncbi:MAG TPA: GNAT family N-acetyltransferase [Planctomycetota bacterium]
MPTSNDDASEGARERTTSPFTIRVDDLRSPAVLALLREHLALAAANSPPGSVHALDADALRGSNVTFWSVWLGSELAGIGALKQLDAAHGELKSMRTVRAHLRKGVATTLIRHMLQVAKQRGYRRLSLETGTTEPFAAAQALYQRFGFARCAPFASYRDDGFSICMTRTLD